MNIETRKYKIVSAAAYGAGFILTQKAGKSGPAWHIFLKTAPAAHDLAMMTESAFDRQAARAMDSGAWL